MNADEREQALARLSDFAKQQQTADHTADQGSLDRAADVVALYEDKGWVVEVEPPKTTRHMGRPVDPESFSRFTKWLGEKKHIALKGTHLYQLRDAHALQMTYFRQAEISPSGERVLRPLKWLTRHGYDDRIPEVWQLACQYAGGQTPTDAVVREALSKWKHDNVPKGQGPPRPTGAAAHHTRLMTEWQWVMENDPEHAQEVFGKLQEAARQYFGRQHAA